MRVLLINYRYFVSGGPERYMFNVKSLLEDRGHDVVPFSIAYERNEPTPYAPYFAPPLSGSSEVYFRDHRRSAKGYYKALERSFYSRPVYRHLGALIEAAQPDVALVLHYLRKLSPSVLKCLADKDVPFAVRLSDFGMICPNAHMLREGRPCELCVAGGLRHSVRHGCVQRSRMASAINYAAISFHRQAGYYDLIRKFIVPSRFTISKMVEAGWHPSRLVHIPTFVPPENVSTTQKADLPTIAYVGRLKHMKGLDTLLEAVQLLEADTSVPPFVVRLAGDGEPSYVEKLSASAARAGLSSVRFEGTMDAPGVMDILREAWCSVVPSLWYENMPNSALESMSCETAVVASDHGSLPEVVRQGETGWLTPPGDSHALAEALRSVIESKERAHEVGVRARAFVLQEHSADRHYEGLMDTLTQLQDVESGGRASRWTYR